MTLTVCIGASGSGKTTFMEDVHKIHKCTYIRQYHNMRPYIVVSKIPDFDPTQLPFWDIYQKEQKADTIQAGGTLAGKFTQGLSGGQRKLLLFELICQRTAHQKDLLILLDEPFSGVTDGFVPFIEERLQKLRQKHNILLVTNDHVDKLTSLADNTIRVSAIDRSVVKVNDREQVDREQAIIALSLGEPFAHLPSHDAYRFFFDVEVISSGSLLQIAIFAVVTMTFFIGTFWDSSDASAPLVAIAGGIIAFFNINPYLLSLVEWRNSMLEESEALVHSSKTLNRVLKVLLTLSIIVLLSVGEFVIVNVVTGGLFLEFQYWVAMLCDSGSLALPLVCLGIFTHLPFQAVQILGSSPFLLMIFCSTTFSPGAGVAVLKELRYLFPRFYFWCILPGSEQQISSLMEGCPSEDLIILYLVLSAFTGVFLFFCFLGLVQLRKSANTRKQEEKREERIDRDQLRDLQKEMYGEKALRRLQQSDNKGDDGSSAYEDTSESAYHDQV